LLQGADIFLSRLGITAAATPTIAIRKTNASFMFKLMMNNNKYKMNVEVGSNNAQPEGAHAR
jgi:hypothetical protein